MYEIGLRYVPKQELIGCFASKAMGFNAQRTYWSTIMCCSGMHMLPSRRVQRWDGKMLTGSGSLNDQFGVNILAAWNPAASSPKYKSSIHHPIVLSKWVIKGEKIMTIAYPISYLNRRKRSIKFACSVNESLLCVGLA